MSEINKSYRISTKIGSGNTDGYITVDAGLVQDYDTFEVLSLNIKSSDTYRLHNSTYGVIVGRVLANNGFGIPNAKVSVFIQVDSEERFNIGNIYPFSSSVSEDKNGVRYNLLPNDRVDGCHQVVGTFPTKRYALDNDVILEVFDKYYTYTTKTNNAGDYMICGVPVGSHTLHMDLDLSDCGILSQKPRDFVYKGYTIEQFESPTKFKSGTDYENLSQIFTQDQVVNVNPFWGNDSLGETIGITRADINVNFKFEPTCVFMGSIISDNASNGFSKKCIPTEHMGDMDELVTGEGKIEMIRKTPGGGVEEFQVKGTKLINANGVWCYQIPMNLDYMVTDEYGNMVPTDNPETGIPTRARVRFRISLDDNEKNTDNFFRAKVLVPHNPQDLQDGTHEGYDYEFGSYTRDDSFRDLFWNNVYSVKSYIPRIQRSNGFRTQNFSGIKHCNIYGPNNPMPYNNIRIKLPLMFTIMCALIKTFVFLTKMLNTVITFIGYILADIGTIHFLKIRKAAEKWWINTRAWEISWAPLFLGAYEKAVKLKLVVLKDGLCPDLENWYFAPMFNIGKLFIEGDDKWNLKITILKPCRANACPEPINCENMNSMEGLLDGEEDGGGDDTGGNYDAESCKMPKYNILQQTIYYVIGEDGNGTPTESIQDDDPNSIDDQNRDDDDDTACITTETDYLLPCVEMNLAQEYKIIKFDFYNDWVNGTIYNPRWVRFIKKKIRFLWITWNKDKVKGCMDDTNIFSTKRNYVQQCAIGYKPENVNGYNIVSKVENPLNNENSSFFLVRRWNKMHKNYGLKKERIFGNRGGISHQATTMKGQYVYYLKPCEWTSSTGKKVNLYATDIILLGTFNDCDLNGIPNTFQHLTSTTYIMPTNLALTNMDTNGPLYATNSGTLCVGNSISQTSSGDAMTNGIIEISGSNQTLESELNYYKNSSTYNISDNYNLVDGDDRLTPGDTMAMTEAAGISWNYTGPGQGDISEVEMYYPGGHFLGLTCVRSQTNLKSCLNLSRICEIGTNMSQKKEDVRVVDENGLRYTYTVPTGFISGDEISDSDFRSMFATLNKKRLIATKRNKSTGYKFYDLEFSMPTNFSGEFKNVVHGRHYGGDNIMYNTKITPVEEDLTLFGILLGSERNDYDAEEVENTQTRTRENLSIDYYFYRLGINFDEFNYTNINKKFLKFDRSKGLFYLPQYENSYYFYFGLRDGATALDEFNKQFNSECDDIKIKKKPNIILTKEVDFCAGVGTIHVFTEGLSIPYQKIVVYNEITNEEVKVITSASEFPHERECLQLESFIIPDGNEDMLLPFGEYKITILDDDDVEISKSIVIGLDYFSYEKSLCDFTKPVLPEGLNPYRNVFDGGFVNVYNFNLLYDNITFDYLTIEFLLYDVEAQEYVGSFEYNEALEYIIYGVQKNRVYTLQLKYKCDDSSEYVYVTLEQIVFDDNSEVQLKLKFDSGAQIDCMNEDIMGLMDKEWWWDKDNFDIGCENSSGLDYIKWLYRKFFFKENNSGPFDSHVVAINGRKVLWGTPQVRYDVLYGPVENVYCSEFYQEIPAGMTLDDTMSYRATYGVNNCETSSSSPVGGEQTRGESETNCISQYSAQAYDGTNVCGIYRGIYDKNGLYGSTGVVTEDGYFHSGCGCVFKPIPYGELQFLVYESDEALTTYLNTEHDDILFGVLYPSFIYPVIKRPFYALYDVTKWTRLKVNRPINNNGVVSKTYSIASNGKKQILTINNGVTLDSKFESVLVDGNDITNDVIIYGPDTYGLTLTSSVNRKSEWSGFTDVELSSQNSEMFYASEHRPDITNGGELLIDSQKTFFINLNYTMSGNSVDTCFGYGSSSPDISYFIGKYNGKDDIGILYLEDNTKYDKYVLHNTNNRTFNVLCQFTEIAENEAQRNSEVIVEVSFNASNAFTINYPYKGFDGVDLVYNESFMLFSGNGLSINIVLDKMYNGDEFVTVGNENVVLPIKPIRNYKVQEEFTCDGVVYNDTRRFFAKLAQKRKLYSIEDARRIGNINYDDILFGVGLCEVQADDGNDGKSYIQKIYPTPLITNEYVEPYIGDGEGYVWCEEEKFVMAGHNVVMISFSASSLTSVYVEIPENWAYFNDETYAVNNVVNEITNEFGCYDNLVHYIVVEFKHNNEDPVLPYTEIPDGNVVYRTNEISFTSLEGKVATCQLKQYNPITKRYKVVLVTKKIVITEGSQPPYDSWEEFRIYFRYYIEQYSNNWSLVELPEGKYINMKYHVTGHIIESDEIALNQIDEWLTNGATFSGNKVNLSCGDFTLIDSNMDNKIIYEIRDE